MTRQTGFYGWKLLAIFWIILFANFAFPLYGASVVNTYMAEALHWDRTQLGTAYAIYQLMIGVPAPLISVLIAKKGARFTTAIGCWIVVGGALLMSSVVHTSWQTYIFYSFTMGLGAMTGGILVAQTGVNRWFNRYKGLAITIVHTGTTFGGFVAARLVDKVIRASGGNWRAGWWLMAGVSTIAAVLAILFVRESPADLGQFPDGATEENPANFRWARREAARAQDQRALDAARRTAHARDLADPGFASRIQRRVSALHRARQRASARSGIFASAGRLVHFDHAALRSLWHALLRGRGGPNRTSPHLGGGVASSSPWECSWRCTPAVPRACTFTQFCWAARSESCFSAMMVLPANYYGVKGYPSVISLMMVVGTIAGLWAPELQAWYSIASTATRRSSIASRRFRFSRRSSCC